MSDTENTSTITVTMAPGGQRFYQGVSAGSKILEAHKDVKFPDETTRRELFMFYAGALAAGEHGCTTTEDFEAFLLGVATRAPQSEPAPSVGKYEGLWVMENNGGLRWSVGTMNENGTYNGGWVTEASGQFTSWTDTELAEMEDLDAYDAVTSDLDRLATKYDMPAGTWVDINEA